MLQQSRGSQLLGEGLAAGAIVVGRDAVQQNEKGPVNSTTIISLPCSVADDGKTEGQLLLTMAKELDLSSMTKLL